MFFPFGARFSNSFVRYLDLYKYFHFLSTDIWDVKDFDYQEK